MLNFNRMAKEKKEKAPPKIPSGSSEDIEYFFESLEKKLHGVPQEVLQEGARKIQEFLEGKIGWADVFNFTPEQMEQMAEMGYNHFKAGRYLDAERFFKVLTILDWDNFYYHSMLGSILQRQKRDGEAIVEYSQALESHPGDVVSLANRGEIFMKHGWFKDAIRDFEKVLTCDAGGNNPWVERSRVLLEQIRKTRKD